MQAKVQHVKDRVVLLRALRYLDVWLFKVFQEDLLLVQQSEVAHFKSAWCCVVKWDYVGGLSVGESCWFDLPE